MWGPGGPLTSGRSLAVSPNWGCVGLGLFVACLWLCRVLECIGEPSWCPLLRVSLLPEVSPCRAPKIVGPLKWFSNT